MCSGLNSVDRTVKAFLSSCIWVKNNSTVVFFNKTFNISVFFSKHFSVIGTEVKNYLDCHTSRPTFNRYINGHIERHIGRCAFLAIDISTDCWPSVDRPSTGRESVDSQPTWRSRLPTVNVTPFFLWGSKPRYSNSFQEIFLVNFLPWWWWRLKFCGLINNKQ